MISFSPIRFEPEIMVKYLELFSACFPSSGKYNLNYLEWLYQQNPSGSAVGFNAWDGHILAAHYVVAPLEVHIDGVNIRALLSLNTATHPLYQGRGLFIKLAEFTYSSATEQGFQAVFGVANANSTSGFVRKLGFQMVKPLDAMIGIGSLSIDLELVKRLAQFRTCWTRPSLAWRCANPNNPVAVRTIGERLQLYAPTIGAGLHAYTELDVLKGGQLDDVIKGHQRLSSPLRLYLGLSPTECKRSRFYINIPRRFRPSPLNFIYKSLSDTPKKLDPDRVSFSFLDFDAY